MTGADLLALIKKQPIAFACGLVLVGAVAAYFLRSDIIDAAQQDAQAKEQEFQKIDANVRSTSGLADATAEIKEAGKQFDTRLVRAPQLANNIQFFYRLESDTGVKLLDVRQLPVPAPRPGEKRGAYVPVPFQVAIQGSFAQVHDFLRRVEAGPHFLRVNQVTVTKFSSGGEGAAFATSGAVNVALNLDLLGTP